MKRLKEDILSENFTRREIINWGIVYPLVGLVVIVTVCGLINLL